MFNNSYEMRKRMSSSGSGVSTVTCLTIDTEMADECEAERVEKSLVLWRRPWMTLKYGLLEAFLVLFNLLLRLLDLRIVGGLVVLIIIYLLPGPHEDYMELCRQNLGFAVYWVILGLLSSVGFGTGLHTFLLYLGPHIASVTLAAYECQSLDFPTPPFPDQMICPKEPYVRNTPNVWQIQTKVRTETLLWGIGTAIGELPPYFMARAARLSGKTIEEQQELDELQQRHNGNLGLFNRSKLLVERVVLRIGFLGILLCASVPNPLFDLAGVACGHFLVPFWKFFVATLIGKAIFKSTIQQLLVVVAFSEDLVNVLVNSLGRMPWIGPRMQAPIEQLLVSTKMRMHHKKKDDSFTGFGLIALAFQLFAVVIVAYFIVSLLNALAQMHYKRLQQKQTQLRLEETEQGNSLAASGHNSLTESFRDSQPIEETQHETRV